MRNHIPRSPLLILIVSLVAAAVGCGDPPAETAATEDHPLTQYTARQDTTYQFELKDTLAGDGYTTHVLRMVSGRWLTEDEVQDPEWWHWVSIVIPDTVESSTGFLLIGGGSRSNLEPRDASEYVKTLAQTTNTVAIQLHNVPNQPVQFVGDTTGSRVEDELIAYGWRRFLEAGAGEEDVEWLARLPMTRAAVRAMDAASSYVGDSLGRPLDRFVVAGASKRGWTTWTTAVADDRVVAIVPIVIDLLNIAPSFEHHWRAYGEWSPAVEDYVDQGIMDWMDSEEFDRLLATVEPYSYLDQLTMPKLLINAAGDEFFLPDSWQFYWDDLRGERHIRYVPNTGHSLDDTDAFQTLIAFHHSIVDQTPRPELDWNVENGSLVIRSDHSTPPESVLLWQTGVQDTRDFRIYVAGETWSSDPVEVSQDGTYRLALEAPESGWKAYFAELTYPGAGAFPMKLTTGVVVVPDSLPFPAYQPAVPRGTEPGGEDVAQRR